MPIFRRPIEEPSRRPRLARLVAVVLIAFGGAAWWALRPEPPRIPSRRVLVVALDGADYALTRRWMDEGRLPNLARLAETGSFHPLRPTAPLTSPSAWASLTTGTTPEKHGIWDAPVQHARLPYAPAPFASWRVQREAAFLWDFLPRHGAELVSLRQAPAFWDLAARQRVPTTVLWMPGAYPVPRSAFLSILAGPEAPDALGGPGLFTYLTTAEGETVAATDFFSGPVVRLTREGIWITGTVPGPISPTVRQRMAGIDRQLEHLTSERGARSELRRKSLLARRARLADNLPLPLPIRLRNLGRRLEVHFGDAETTVAVGQWSPPLAITMKINALLSLSGVCRFHLIALEPEIRLYLSPLDLSPTDEAALAYPVSFARRMVEAGGLLKTRGAPSEWAGLAAGRLPEAAFLSDLEATWKERTAAAKTALERDWGLFCCAFSDPADTQRMFWRFLEPEQRAGEAQLSAAQRDAILRAYRRIDDWIGGLLRTHADPDTVVLVLSAHGYTGFRKAVDLNRWLVDVGYMRLSADSTSRPTQLHGYLQRQAGMGQASGIDWSQTDAYALGAGSVYLNLKGREPAGTVPPGAQAELLRSRLAGELAALRDPEAGDPVVARVVLGARLETATAEGRGPDLLVEFRPGYRMAWPSMLGGVGDAWLSPNRDRWSGDFAGMEPHRLPGVFFCNRKTEAQPQSIDVAPTVLSLLGLPIPDTMEGRPLLSVNRAAEP